MAITKSAVILFAIMALFGASMAAVYNVGDANGWTASGGINYKKWADEKTFHVGDTLEFNYSPERHDMKQVNKADFESCNGNSPIATFTSGSDSITLKEPGHAYFLCGFTGHCQAGQKLEVNVQPAATSPKGSPKATATPERSPTSTPSSTSTDSSSSESSTPPSGAQSLYSSNGWLASALLAFGFAGFAF